MKLFVKRSVVFVLVITLAVSRLSAQIPAGGTSIIKDANTFYSKVGKGTLTASKIDSLSFLKVFRFTTAVDVANAWDAQLAFTTTNNIVSGDVILVSFFARTASSIQETGEGYINVCIENKTTYDKVVYQTLPVGAEWKQYYVSLKSPYSLVASNINCSFHLGFVSQTIEIADINFINYASTKKLEELPVTQITYDGREVDAPWRAEAEERINQIRKGNVQITVVDKLGNPVSNAEVTVEMTRHNFGFGSAITASNYLTNPTYKAKILEMFNEVVFEGDLKWIAFITKTTEQKNQIIQVLNDLDSHNIKMRGHNVLWPSWKYNPAYLQSYKNSPENLRLEINKHIDEICTFTRGRVIDWDVINEPYTEHDWMDILGKNEMVEWFKRVRVNEPVAKLYLNDFGILSSNGVNYTKQDAYIETVKYINSLGGGVQGIGFQGHFGSDLTPIPRLKTILDKFSALNVDMKVTEFDIDMTQQILQADYTRDFMTLLFSHPSVKSILIWGFWEKSHWRPNAAMYNSDWSLRPNGIAYRDLILNKWWTKQINSTTNQTGLVNYNGFLGTYSYTVKYNGKNYTGSFDIVSPVSSGIINEITLTIDETVPAGIEKTTSNDLSCFKNTPTNVELFDLQGRILSKNQYPTFSEELIFNMLTKDIHIMKISNTIFFKTFKFSKIQTQ